MSRVIRVLLIEDNPIEARQTRFWLSRAAEASFEVDNVDRLELGLERLARVRPDVVLLDLNLPDSRGLDTFAAVLSRHPDVPVVVLTGEIDSALGVAAVERGAEDYLVKQQVTGPDLVRVLRFAVARHGAYTERAIRSAEPFRGKVIGFVGAKGGVGTTTVAANVAAAVASRGKSVVLVELRPSYGTLAFDLRAEPQERLTTLLELPAEGIRREEMTGTLARGPAGVRILYGPKPGDPPTEIDPAHAEAVVNRAAELADFVVLDLPGEPTAATETVSRLCRYVGVVTDREPGSIHCGSVAVDRLGRWGVSAALVGGVVVTRTVVPVMMGLADVVIKLGCKVTQVIPPAAAACQRAREEGVPIVLSQPESDAAKAFADLAGHVADGRPAGVAA